MSAVDTVLPPLLKDWTNANVRDWAAEKYPKVVKHLADFDGLDLVGWRTEANFKEYLGGPYGAAFYGHLLGAPLVPVSSHTHTKHRRRVYGCAALLLRASFLCTHRHTSRARSCRSRSTCSRPR